MSKLPLLETCRFAVNGNNCGNCERDLSDCWSPAPFFPASAKSAPVPGGSGALLAGNPLTMSGDAWEAAAHHVIAIREKRQSNGDTWRQIGQFLDSMPKAGS